MNDTNQKYFIYARKSTDDLSRQVRSIDDQIAELRDLAKKGKARRAGRAH
jgi:DNA invertase Pin-like site-specific DNA recombinase